MAEEKKENRQETEDREINAQLDVLRTDVVTNVLGRHETFAMFKKNIRLLYLVLDLDLSKLVILRRFGKDGGKRFVHLAFEQIKKDSENIDIFPNPYVINEIVGLALETLIGKED